MLLASLKGNVSFNICFDRMRKLYARIFFCLLFFFKNLHIRSFALFISLFLVFSFSFFIPVFAQAPQGINYQAVARDAAGNPLAVTAVTVIFEIRQGAAGGPAVYRESHSLSTNQFGLFSAVIGGGSPSFGTFSSISWGTNTYWLNVCQYLSVLNSKLLHL